MERPVNPLPAGMHMVAAMDRRQTVLESIRQKFAAKGTVQTQGFLRLVCRLVANQTTLRFRLMNDQGAQFDTERRLARTDSFTATDIGLFLAAIPVAGAATNQGADLLRTAPSPSSVLLGITEAIFAAMHMGRLKVTCDSVVFVDDLDMGRSRGAGTAQQGLDAGGGVDYVTDAWGPEQGMFPLLPSITLSGAMKNDIVIELPRSLAYAGTATNHIDVVLQMHGILNQQGAEFRAE